MKKAILAVLLVALMAIAGCRASGAAAIDGESHVGTAAESSAR